MFISPTLFFYCRRSNTRQKYTFRPPFKDPQDTSDTSIKAQVVQSPSSLKRFFSSLVLYMEIITLKVYIIRVHAKIN